MKELRNLAIVVAGVLLFGELLRRGGAPGWEHLPKRRRWSR